MAHPSIESLLDFFETEHLRPRQRAVSEPFRELAHGMAKELSEGPELSAGLRKLLEAKDCAVRASLDGSEDQACVICGCTEDHACEGGCSWVANDLGVDLCSACAVRIARVA